MVIFLDESKEKEIKLTLKALNTCLWEPMSCRYVDWPHFIFLLHRWRLRFEICRFTDIRNIKMRRKSRPIQIPRLYVWHLSQWYVPLRDLWRNRPEWNTCCICIRGKCLWNIKSSNIFTTITCHLRQHYLYQSRLRTCL